jgi:hypothetical protein
MIDINIDRLFYFESNNKKHIVCMCLNILFRTITFVRSTID